jgi:hypothetical protein
MALNSGATIGDRYRLQRFIAAGGMGEVWEATDSVLGRRVAVKVLKSEFSSDPEFLGRFRVEARTTAKLNHPGIANVYDYGETSDSAGRSTAFLVMELVNGEPLNTVLARMGAVPLPLALDMLEQTGRALQAAHAEGLVHRDVKPGNILITPSGQVKITDFGIAKAIDAAPVTRTGMVMGTAQYISPEQAMGQNATAASDVYSLGVVAYEAIAGRRPFGGEGVLTVAMKHIHEQPEPLPADLPANVRTLIDIALTKDPSARYRNGGEFADAVAAVRAGRPVPDPRGGHAAPAAGAPILGSSHTRVLPPPATGATAGMPGRRPHTAAAAGVGAAGVGAAGYHRPSHGAPARRDDENRGLTSGQRILGIGAAALLILAIIATGALLLSNLVDPRDDGGAVPTPIVPTPTLQPTLAPTTVPPTTVQTTTAEPTTTEETTTEETTTTTEETTTTEPEPTATETEPGPPPIIDIPGRGPANGNGQGQGNGQGNQGNGNGNGQGQGNQGNGNGQR